MIDEAEMQEELDRIIFEVTRRGGGAADLAARIPGSARTVLDQEHGRLSTGIDQRMMPRRDSLGTRADDRGGAVGVDWNLPDIKKRSEAQRAESLANRLWKSVVDHDEVSMRLILRLMGEESWKKGQPITYDDVKKIAVEQLKLAAAKMGRPKV